MIYKTIDLKNYYYYYLLFLQNCRVDFDCVGTVWSFMGKE